MSTRKEMFNGIWMDAGWCGYQILHLCTDMTSQARWTSVLLLSHSDWWVPSKSLHLIKNGLTGVGILLTILLTTLLTTRGTGMLPLSLRCQDQQLNSSEKRGMRLGLRISAWEKRIVKGKKSSRNSKERSAHVHTHTHECNQLSGQ